MNRLAFAAAIAAVLTATPALADDKGREVAAVMTEYVKLWNAGDAGAITSRIYRFDSPNPMGDKAGLEAQFAQLKKEGYDHSETQAIEACVIGPNQAMAEMRYTRLKTDGTPLGPKDRAGLYLLRKFPEGWRITRIVGMSASADLTCRSAAE